MVGTFILTPHPTPVYPLAAMSILSFMNPCIHPDRVTVMTTDSHTGTKTSTTTTYVEIVNCSSFCYLVPRALFPHPLPNHRAHNNPQPTTTCFHHPPINWNPTTLPPEPTTPGRSRDEIVPRRRRPLRPWPRPCGSSGGGLSG
jgi:hypothetical protein